MLGMNHHLHICFLLISVKAKYNHCGGFCQASAFFIGRYINLLPRTKLCFHYIRPPLIESGCYQLALLTPQWDTLLNSLWQNYWFKNQRSNLSSTTFCILDGIFFIMVQYNINTGKLFPIARVVINSCSRG